MANYRLYSPKHNNVAITRNSIGDFTVGRKPVKSEHLMGLIKSWNRAMGPGKPLKVERVDGE